jgi:rhodanese-related sulfurtransferase
MKKFLATVFAFSVAPLVMFAGEFPDISIAELKKAIAEKKVVVIDVNGAESYKSGHIPTAVNYSAVQSDLASVLPKEKDALNLLFLLLPVANVGIPFIIKSFPVVFSADVALLFGVVGWTGAPPLADV